MNGKKIFKKTVGAALLGACVLGSAVSFTACTSSHPEVQMKVSFNGETYTLNYELYRKIAPSTTQHFLDLVKAKYYDGLCVHNYTETKWYTGGYTYDEANSDEVGGLVEIDYFAKVAGLKLTQTVWHDGEKNDPAYTLYGEFTNNGFKVTAGALKQSFGSLTMYYTAKDDIVASVYAKRSDGGKNAGGQTADWKDYKYNSATSLFYMSLSTSTGAASASYCTFATIKSGSKDDLTELKQAVSEYVSEAKEGNADYSFTTTVDAPTDLGDRYVENGTTASYNVPVEPIIIESIRITKY